MFIPSLPGIYAILVQENGLFGSVMRPVYIGESENLKERLTVGHEKCDDWKREAAGRELNYAVHTTVGMTGQQRRDVECELINRYTPACNTKMGLYEAMFSKNFLKG